MVRPVSSISLHQLLTLYSWFPLAGLLLLILLIARFYQRFSGFRTCYLIFAICVVLAAVWAVRRATLTTTAPDEIASFFGLITGLLLIAASIRLYIAMLLGRE